MTQHTLSVAGPQTHCHGSIRRRWCSSFLVRFFYYWPRRQCELSFSQLRPVPDRGAVHPMNKVCCGLSCCAAYLALCVYVCEKRQSGMHSCMYARMHACFATEWFLGSQVERTVGNMENGRSELASVRSIRNTRAHVSCVGLAVEDGGWFSLGAGSVVRRGCSSKHAPALFVLSMLVLNQCIVGRGSETPGCADGPRVRTG